MNVKRHREGGETMQEDYESKEERFWAELPCWIGIVLLFAALLIAGNVWNLRLL